MSTKDIAVTAAAAVATGVAVTVATATYGPVALTLWLLGVSVGWWLRYHQTDRRETYKWQRGFDRGRLYERLGAVMVGVGPGRADPRRELERGRQPLEHSS